MPHHKEHGHAKVGKVMHEFKEGKLKSGSGHKVTSRDQAIAIALSEAGMSKKSRHGSGVFSAHDMMMGFMKL